MIKDGRFVTSQNIEDLRNNRQNIIRLHFQTQNMRLPLQDYILIVYAHKIKFLFCYVEM